MWGNDSFHFSHHGYIFIFNIHYMKKAKLLIALVAIMFFGAASASAQFHYGVKLGVNIDKMSVKGVDWSDSNRCGFTGGFTAEYTVPIIGLGFDASLMYSRLSVADADYVLSNEGTDGVLQPILDKVGSKGGNFFEIPIHLKYKLNVPAIAMFLKPYAYTGPSVAFQLGGDNDYFKTKDTQWGWDLGLGIDVLSRLQIGAGYTWGMNKVANWALRNSSHATVTDNVKVRNNYWTVTAAWMF